MILTNLTAVSPIDGRYGSVTQVLSDYFSEFALIKYRVNVEVEYFVALCQIPLPELKLVPAQKITLLKMFAKNLTIEQAQRVKEIEKITNHDVKAVEYLIKEEFDRLELTPFKEFIHFGLTSQDINNTSIPMSVRDAFSQVYIPLLIGVKESLSSCAQSAEDVSMLARTHGQPASPTVLGKEIAVFVYRLDQQIKLFSSIPFSGKFGGATGNFNAHHLAYPQIDWVEFGQTFLSDYLQIERETYTTQISNYDHLAALMDGMKRINTILIDACRDFWQYISMDYFKQKIKEGEVGSSAMPHKVNPIDFENAEGNLGIANALLEHLSGKLPISRLQRDLTDSTVLRNIGVPFAHQMIALNSLLKGINKLLLNREKISSDLDNCWSVVAEAIQTVLRREGYPAPYEALKALTRTNSVIDQEAIHSFIDTLNVSQEVKTELLTITPHNYTGVYSRP